ncbi:MAG: hypothetical protein ABI165_17605 [Bryobacteraceae bacterium]
MPLDFPDDNSMRISHEAIYPALYVQGPRGAQVRTRCGRSLNPLSSTKTIVRRSLSAFFKLGASDISSIAGSPPRCAPVLAR